MVRLSMSSLPIATPSAVQSRHHRAEPHLDAERLERAPRLL
jgi:hypothetical protein